MLLSAPSIIIGLFIYEIVVVRMGHFSAIAGALALAILAIPSPCVPRRTCSIWCRVGMKDSSAALGAYPWRTTLSVLYPAARSGIVTGPAAGDRAHQRRDRAAPVHRAQQSVLEHAT